ncbi:2-OXOGLUTARATE (2OG) AND FE(II)-DEPENDENT OXYGENASE SUPERFAMILY PROTEIN-RELATED [Salix koriyanagi]|uniref:2-OXOGLUTARATE (2OG) AND FE(II)-DEPENDENT OXYGENASE SUPERFAMILY PROTEIN-RELATED n=1 Tax=Salix koriyanagi TaxID=2511006 RepID=A0A9Q0UDS0_9ROSI|nr:2-OXOGLUTARATE (2OG) AND FE(II)-DEPENDENT OXYGENASE SUPERFAMILY PROTEIN-RELATED [Salix koriyanagi]
MVLLPKPALEQFSLMRNIKPTTFFSGIPLIDLSNPDSKHLLVKACEEFGFFKVVNHGVPLEFILKLESEAVKFFSLPLSEKEKAGPPNPFGYGNKSIGQNGDVGWVEYLLLTANQESISQRLSSVFGDNPEKFRRALNDYISAVKKMACEILEMMADEIQALKDHDMIGFGEHTDPQIISVLRSNNTSGLQISLNDGSWLSVPPDLSSFFINVGDSLQVMTNGRFKSVRHRVLANSMKARVSMIYFGGPPLGEKIAPLPSLMRGKESLYREFTWFEYKRSAYSSRLADNKLLLFERITPS